MSARVSRTGRATQIRSEKGMLVRRTRHWVDGPFCRNCGLCTFRTMTNYTLLKGWWGMISFFVNWATILNNIGAWWRFRGLATPVAVPGVKGLVPRPFDPGPSIFRRSGIWVTGAVILFFVAISAANRSNTPTTAVTPVNPPSNYALAGRCLVVSTDGAQIQKVVDCGQAHNARVLSVVAQASSCPSAASATFSSPTLAGVLCVSYGQ